MVNRDAGNMRAIRKNRGLTPATSAELLVSVLGVRGDLALAVFRVACQPKDQAEQLNPRVHLDLQGRGD
jgi:hypothetical protein